MSSIFKRIGSRVQGLVVIIAKLSAKRYPLNAKETEGNA